MYQRRAPLVCRALCFLTYLFIRRLWELARRMIAKAFRDLYIGISLYHVWIYQAYHDITAKYKRTFLGSFWLAGSMVVTSVSLAVLFGALFHQPLQQSLPYVMSGMLAFSMVGYVLIEAPEVFMSSAPIIRNHAYPFSFYMLHSIAKNFFMFLHNIVIYWGIMAAIGGLVIPNWTLLVGLPMILVFMFCCGSVAAMIASRYRDLRFMLPYLGQLLSFLTPIFWRIDGLSPGWLLSAVTVNPVYNMIQMVRRPLMGQVATSQEWMYAATYVGLGCLVWLGVFSIFRRRIAFWV
jgi:ABC-type polysaccharide/polyol phosphate export permease